MDKASNFEQTDMKSNGIHRIALILIFPLFLAGCSTVEIASEAVWRFGPAVIDGVNSHVSQSQNVQELVVTPPDLADHTDKLVCSVALKNDNDGNPTWDKVLPDHVAEAKRRGLTPASCREFF